MKENKESKGTQFEEEKILLTEDQVKDQTEIKEETEKDDMVENGVHNYSTEESYVWPTDPAVRKKLEWFRDQKLGLMMHWGAYSQLGIVESWALSDADAWK